MNCPSRTEEHEGDGFNQNPSALSADLTTREDLNGIANARILRRLASSESEQAVEHVPDDDVASRPNANVKGEAALTSQSEATRRGEGTGVSSTFNVLEGGSGGGGHGPKRDMAMKWVKNIQNFCMTFGRFVGPGFMVRKTLPSSKSALKNASRFLWPILIPETMQLMLLRGRHIASSFSSLC
jgi:metal iron transporter